MGTTDFKTTTTTSSGVLSAANKAKVDADTLNGASSNELLQTNKINDYYQTISPDIYSTIPAVVVGRENPNIYSSYMIVTIDDPMELYSTDVDNIIVEISRDKDFNVIDYRSEGYIGPTTGFNPKLEPSITHYARAKGVINGADGVFSKVTTFISSTGVTHTSKPEVSIINNKNICRVIVSKVEHSEGYTTPYEYYVKVYENGIFKTEITSSEQGVVVDTRESQSYRLEVSCIGNSSSERSDTTVVEFTGSVVNTEVSEIINVPFRNIYYSLLCGINDSLLITGGSTLNDIYIDNNRHSFLISKKDSNYEFRDVGLLQNSIIYSSSTSPNGKYLATGDGIFNTGTNTSYRVYNGVICETTPVMISPNRYFYAIDNDGGLYMCGGVDINGSDIYSTNIVLLNTEANNVADMPLPIVRNRISVLSDKTIIVAGGGYYSGGSFILNNKIYTCSPPYTTWVGEVTWEPISYDSVSICGLDDNRIIIKDYNNLYEYKVGYSKPKHIYTLPLGITYGNITRHGVGKVAIPVLDRYKIQILVVRV